METKILTTSGGHKVEIKTVVTARDRRTINVSMFEKVNFRLEGRDAKMGDVPGTVAASMEDAMIRTLVVSLDGSHENILERMLDLPEKDFSEVDVELQRLSAGDVKKDETP